MFRMSPQGESKQLTVILPNGLNYWLVKTKRSNRTYYNRVKTFKIRTLIHAINHNITIQAQYLVYLIKTGRIEPTSRHSSPRNQQASFREGEQYQGTSTKQLPEKDQDHLP